MGLIRKNPFFFAALAAAVVIFAGGLLLFLRAEAARARAAGELELLHGRIAGLLGAAPAPMSPNLEAARANVRELRRQLLLTRADLQRGARMETISDGVRLMAAIQEHIATYRRRLEEVDPVIEAPETFAFGFPRYARESSPPPEHFIPVLDRQRRILAYLVDRLILSGPEQITRVRRETVELEEDGSGPGFRIAPEISARVPGVVDTLAFEVGFTGYTEVLRRFLTELAAFDRPVVVRRVEVRRPRAVAARPDRVDIFSIFDAGSDAGEAPERTRAQRPVIDENLSEFTVTLEFIELAPTGEPPFASDD